MLLVIDNYDSFTYNLVQYFGELGADPVVKRNDAVTADEVERMRPDKIVISPGPGTPADAGISMGLIRRFGPKLPILGVCLGHQSIGEVYGGKVVRAERLMHGKTSPIRHDGKGGFCRTTESLRSHPVSFVAGGKEIGTGVSGSHGGYCGRGNYGVKASGVSRSRGAVPP